LNRWSFLRPRHDLALEVLALRTFSIAEFLTRPGVLVLGTDPDSAGAMATLNALVLQALTRRISDAPPAPGPRHWFVFDDLDALGAIEPVCRLLDAGRCKGTSITMGTQSMERLSARYGEQSVNDMISQCGHKSFLRLGDMPSARQAEKTFHGTADVLIEWRGDDHALYSTRRCVQAGPFLIAPFFLRLPSLGRGGPFISVSENSNADSAVISRVSLRELFDWCKVADPTVARPPDTRQHGLTDWSEDEERFFCGDLSQQPLPHWGDSRAGQHGQS
jgi:hypothetical protein